MTSINVMQLMGEFPCLHGLHAIHTMGLPLLDVTIVTCRDSVAICGGH